MTEEKKIDKILKLVPPTDPRVRSAVAPFTDDMLKEHNFKDRKELSGADIIGRDDKYNKVKLDSTFPSYILENKHLFQDWII